MVSGIKNGPQAVQRVASALQDLSKLLQQLQDCADPFFLRADLERLVGTCAKDLKAIKDEIGKLAKPAANKAVKSWGNLKAMLKERDLEGMSNCIRQHVIILSLQMQIIEGFVQLT